jgi:hypothetical protein
MFPVSREPYFEDYGVAFRCVNHAGGALQQGNKRLSGLLEALIGAADQGPVAG